jgi:hypothetical protein
MAKTEKLYNQLYEGLDEQAYTRLERTAPWLVEAVTALVKAGETPKQIKGQVLAKYGNLWVEAQTIEQAARHVKAIE